MRDSIRKRIAVITFAVIAALVVFAVVRLLGVEPTAGKGDDADPIGVIDIVVATVVAGFAAWGVHALVERWTRSDRWWIFVVTMALAISMNGPSWLSDGSSTVALICMHFAVGIVLITGFTMIGSRQRDCEGEPRGANRMDRTVRPVGRRNVGEPQQSIQ